MSFSILSPYIPHVKKCPKNAPKVHLTLPQTNRTDITPENWWLGDKPFLLGPDLFFTGYVRFREGKENDSAFRLLAFKRFFGECSPKSSAVFFPNHSGGHLGSLTSGRSQSCKRLGFLSERQESIENTWEIFGATWEFRVCTRWAPTTYKWSSGAPRSRVK